MTLSSDMNKLVKNVTLLKETHGDLYDALMAILDDLPIGEDTQDQDGEVHCRPDETESEFFARLVETFGKDGVKDVVIVDEDDNVVLDTRVAQAMDSHLGSEELTHNHGSNVCVFAKSVQYGSLRQLGYTEVSRLDDDSFDDIVDDYAGSLITGEFLVLNVTNLLDDTITKYVIDVDLDGDYDVECVIPEVVFDNEYSDYDTCLGVDDENEPKVIVSDADSTTSFYSLAAYELYLENF